MNNNNLNEYTVKVMKNNSRLTIEKHKNTTLITTDWGDGNVNGELNHQYQVAGEYTVRTTCRPIQQLDKYYSIRIVSCNSLSSQIVDCTNMFKDYIFITSSPQIPIGVINCTNMFYNCQKLIEPPIIPDNVINCNGMFQFCYELVSSPVIPGRVINCSKMFQYCKNLTDINAIPNNVKDCFKMFRLCGSLEEAPIISSNVNNCSQMFEYCSKLKLLPQENIDLLSEHNELLLHERCYNGCKKIRNVNYDLIPQDWK